MTFARRKVAERRSMTGQASRRRQSANARRQTPVGFTLLEVLLSISLTVILLSAVYAAMEMHWTFSTIGQIEVERSQAARVLLQKIGADIRSVVYRAADSSSTDSTTTEETTTDQGTGVPTTDDTMTEEEIIPGVQLSVGVVGDATSLLLHISKPMRDTSFTALETGEDTAAYNSDLLSVAYLMAGSEGNIVLEMMPIELPEGTGLTRVQGDRLLMSLADLQGDSSFLQQQTEILAPEVTYLEFAYFDGVEWLEEWDSTTLAALPTAIGITIGFEEIEQQSGLFNTGTIAPRTVSASTNSYRLVVALPLADNPAEIEMSL